MANLDPAQRLMPSILDRLIDPESGGTAAGQGYGMQQMIEAVRRDLEDLLNTRQTSAGIPEVFTDVLNSIVAYGMPDLTLVNALTEADRTGIGGIIEGIVARFEPRLKDIRATLVETNLNLKTDRMVKFELDARLSVEPSPEVGFQTTLELMTGHASIKKQEL